MVYSIVTRECALDDICSFEFIETCLRLCCLLMDVPWTYERNTCCAALWATKVVDSLCSSGFCSQADCLLAFSVGEPQPYIFKTLGSFPNTTGQNYCLYVYVINKCEWRFEICTHYYGFFSFSSCPFCFCILGCIPLASWQAFESKVLVLFTTYPFSTLNHPGVLIINIISYFWW